MKKQFSLFLLFKYSILISEVSGKLYCLIRSGNPACQELSGAELIRIKPETTSSKSTVSANIPAKECATKITFDSEAIAGIISVFQFSYETFGIRLEPSPGKSNNHIFVS